MGDYNKVLVARCACCGREGHYEMNDQEYATFLEYQYRGRELGYIQELFPTVPSWIRSGAIDRYSEGFCICPNCC